MAFFLRPILALACLPAILAFVPLEDFFPYGPGNGDLRVPTADDNFENFQIGAGHVFNFFNNTYTNLFVNNNGGISFGTGVATYTPNCGPLTTPMIVPYWADVNTIVGGNVYYRESTDPALIQKARDEVQRAFPGLTNLNLNWLFIATWDDAAFYGATDVCGGASIRNSFQTILVTDGSTSFVKFFYNKINWTTGTASGGNCTGLGGTPAKAGFDLGDGQTFFSIPGTCTDEIVNIASTTNVNQPGKWIFRVDHGLDAPEPQPEEPQPEERQPEEPLPQPQPEEPEPIEDPTCDISSCQHSGFCFQYASCNRASSTWEGRNCSDGLFWNPHHTGQTTLTECYGSCDVWENLTPETKLAYKTNEHCFPLCYYRELGECSGTYVYHSKDADIRTLETVHCPVDTRHGFDRSLVWVQERETCDFCYNAHRSDGSPCCEKYDDHVEANPEIPSDPSPAPAPAPQMEPAAPVPQMAPAPAPAPAFPTR